MCSVSDASGLGGEGFESKVFDGLRLDLPLGQNGSLVVIGVGLAVAPISDISSSLVEIVDSSEAVRSTSVVPVKRLCIPCRPRPFVSGASTGSVLSVLDLISELFVSSGVSPTASDAS